MKKLLFVLSIFVLSININAQNSTSYTQFRYDIMNIEVIPIEQIKFVDDPAFKPAIILLSTFTINHIIINTSKDHEYTSLLTGTVFLAGITTSIIVFSHELKKQKTNY